MNRTDRSRRRVSSFVGSANVASRPWRGHENNFSTSARGVSLRTSENVYENVRRNSGRGSTESEDCEQACLAKNKQGFGRTPDSDHKCAHLSMHIPVLIKEPWSLPCEHFDSQNLTFDEIPLTFSSKFLRNPCRLIGRSRWCSEGRWAQFSLYARKLHFIESARILEKIKAAFRYLNFRSHSVCTRSTRFIEWTLNFLAVYLAFPLPDSLGSRIFQVTGWVYCIIRKIAEELKIFDRGVTLPSSTLL